MAYQVRPPLAQIDFQPLGAGAIENHCGGFENISASSMYHLSHRFDYAQASAEADRAPTKNKKTRCKVSLSTTRSSLQASNCIISNKE